MKKFILVLSLISLFVACSDDDEKIDFIQVSLGDYNVIASDFQLIDGEWVEQPEFEDDFDFTLEKGSAANTLEIFFGNELLFELSDVNTGENGYSFNLDELEFDGERWVGYNASELGNTNQHGSYNHLNKTLTFYIRRTGDTNAYLTRFVAVKK